MAVKRPLISQRLPLADAFARGATDKLHIRSQRLQPGQQSAIAAQCIATSSGVENSQLVVDPLSPRLRFKAKRHGCGAATSGHPKQQFQFALAASVEDDVMRTCVTVEETVAGPQRQFADFDFTRRRVFRRMLEHSRLQQQLANVANWSARTSGCDASTTQPCLVRAASSVRHCSSTAPSPAREVAGYRSARPRTTDT